MYFNGLWNNFQTTYAKLVNDQKESILKYDLPQSIKYSLEDKKPIFFKYKNWAL